MIDARLLRALRSTQADRPRDDAGGLWIRVGIGLGIIFYLFMVVLWAAGFTAIVPFVIIPLVLVALIGANSMLGGPRRRQQLAPRPIGPTDQGADPSSSESVGTLADGGGGADSSEVDDAGLTDATDATGATGATGATNGTGNRAGLDDDESVTDRGGTGAGG